MEKPFSSRHSMGLKISLKENFRELFEGSFHHATHTHTHTFVIVFVNFCFIEIYELFSRCEHGQFVQATRKQNPWHAYGTDERRKCDTVSLAGLL